MTPKVTKSVLFIIGTSFCGSTALGNKLNAHPDATFIGESDRLQFFGQYEGYSNYYTNKCTLCSTRDSYDCPLWSEGLIADAERQPSLAAQYLHLIKDFPGEVVIDGSKNPDWIARLIDSGLNIPVRAILLVRNPLAFSVSNRGAVPDEPLWKSAEGWQNLYSHALRVLSSRNIPMMILRNEDVVSNLGESINLIHKFAGLRTDESWRNHTCKASHSIGGNMGAYMRYSEFSLKGFARLDPREFELQKWKNDVYGKDASNEASRASIDRWKEELTMTEISQIINLPRMIDQATLLGYDLLPMIIERSD